MQVLGFILFLLLDVRAHIPKQPSFDSGRPDTSYGSPAVRAIVAFLIHRGVSVGRALDGRSLRHGILVMSGITRRLACAALLSCLALPAAQAQNPDANIVVTQAWSRATPGGSKVAGGYLTIENKGSAPDKLLSASTNAAKKIEVHEMAVNEGVMTMRPVEGGLSIAPGRTVKFTPGGLHLMIIGLSAPLVQGDKVPVALKFEKAGEITVSFDVRTMGARAPGPLSNATDPAAHAVATM
jgi:periplasmic copper chaperone A